MRWATFWLSIILSVPVQAAYSPFYITTASFPAAVHKTTLEVIADYQVAAAAEAMRGTVYYYCDCGTGAAGNCVVGDNAAAGTDPASPRQTLASASSRYAGLTKDTLNTIAFCKGGSFVAVGTSSMAVDLWNANKCTAGSTCTDFREYASPNFTSSAKPRISQNPAYQSQILFSFAGLTSGGVRIMNLDLEGNDIADGNLGGSALFAYNGTHDVELLGNDINYFMEGISQVASTNGSPDVVLRGNSFVGNFRFVMFGGGARLKVNYNYMEGNGGTNDRDHTLYVAGVEDADPDNIEIIGNYMHGQYGLKCYGAILALHGQFDGLLVKDNYFAVEDSADTPGCYGTGFGHGNYSSPAYSRNSVYSGNTVINGGTLAMGMSNSPDVIVENNLIIFTSSAVSGVRGIIVGENAARTSPYADDVNERNVIRNNTIWIGPNVVNAYGIIVKTEGTGHIVSNNSITYMSTNPGSGTAVNCFDYQLPLTSYAFVNNNHCYANAAHKWSYTNGATLAAWQTYSSGLDSASIEGAPNFTSTGITGNYHPAVGSPLIGAGNNTYKSASDAWGTARPNPPAIGAFEP